MEKNIKVSFAYGVLCLILGSLWLLHTMALLPWQLSEYLLTWRFLLVIVGVFIIVKNNKSIFGLLVFAAGLVSSAVYFWDMPEGWENYLPPIALMIVGGVLVLRPLKERIMNSSSPIGDDSVNRATIFGSFNQVVTSILFKGGYLSAILGTNKVDFTKTHLGQESVNVRSTTIFGTNILVVPDSWDLEVSVVNIFGSTSDQRVIVDSGKEKEGTLHISGLNLFGTLKIKE